MPGRTFRQLQSGYSAEHSTLQELFSTSPVFCLWIAICLICAFGLALDTYRSAQLSPCTLTVVRINGTDGIIVTYQERLTLSRCLERPENELHSMGAEIQGLCDSHGQCVSAHSNVNHPIRMVGSLVLVALALGLMLAVVRLWRQKRQVRDKLQWINHSGLEAITVE